MLARRVLPATILLAAGSSAMAQAPWVVYENETAARLVADPSLVVNDNLEKIFCWDDFDQDGDIDIVMVRKFPGSITGGYSNVVFMNEGGVLVDRTAEYGHCSDSPGYLGFPDPTNDRRVHAIDVDNDGWMDLVTCTTMSDGLDWQIGQPRVYMNRGDDPSGNWLGFCYEHLPLPADVRGQRQRREPTLLRLRLRRLQRRRLPRPVHDRLRHAGDERHAVHRSQSGRRHQRSRRVPAEPRRERRQRLQQPSLLQLGRRSGGSRARALLRHRLHQDDAGSARLGVRQRREGRRLQRRRPSRHRPRQHAHRRPGRRHLLREPREPGQRLHRSRLGLRRRALQHRAGRPQRRWPDRHGRHRRRQGQVPHQQRQQQPGPGDLHELRDRRQPERVRQPHPHCRPRQRRPPRCPDRRRRCGPADLLPDHRTADAHLPQHRRGHGAARRDRPDHSQRRTRQHLRHRPDRPRRRRLARPGDRAVPGRLRLHEPAADRPGLRLPAGSSLERASGRRDRVPRRDRDRRRRPDRRRHRDARGLDRRRAVGRASARLRRNELGRVAARDRLRFEPSLLRDRGTLQRRRRDRSVDGAGDVVCRERLDGHRGRLRAELRGERRRLDRREQRDA